MTACGPVYIGSVSQRDNIELAGGRAAIPPVVYPSALYLGAPERVPRELQTAAGSIPTSFRRTLA